LDSKVVDVTENSSIRLVICTCKTFQTEKIVNYLVEKRIIACANVISGIASTYWWKKKIEKEKEDIILMETKKDLVSTLIKEIKKIHSYQVPKIITLDVKEGLEAYISWVKEETLFK